MAHGQAVASSFKNIQPCRPVRLTARKYSGKFMVRVPPEVHRHLAIEAAESGVSLNRIASAKLAH